MEQQEPQVRPCVIADNYACVNHVLGTEIHIHRLTIVPIWHCGFSPCCENIYPGNLIMKPSLILLLITPDVLFRPLQWRADITSEIRTFSLVMRVQSASQALLI